MLNLLAQVAPPTPEWRNEVALAIVAITPILVRLLVWASFFVVERIPKWALPTAAVVIATGLDFLSGIATSDPILAAAVTFASIGLREVIDRFFTQPLGLNDTQTVSDGRYLRKV